MTGDRRDECHPCARLTGARTGSRVARVAPPEFYVGYLDETPPGISRFARRAVIGLLLLAAALGAGLALLLERFDEGVFEYGTVREYSGELLVDPHPRLLTADGPAGGYLLVAEGKHAIAVHRPPSLPWKSHPAVEARLSGALIRNPEAAMLEVHSLQVTSGPIASETDSDSAGDSEGGTIRLQVGSGDAAVETDPAQPGDTPVLRMAGMRTFIGEIVDTKCYLGAMKPGRGKPHRDCASLCIRGGIPAALLVRTESGDRALLHLMNLFGQPIGREVLEWVGEPVEVTGILRRHDDRLVLMTVPHRAAPVTSAAAAVRPHRPSPDHAETGR